MDFKAGTTIKMLRDDYFIPGTKKGEIFTIIYQDDPNIGDEYFVISHCHYSLPKSGLGTLFELWGQTTGVITNVTVGNGVSPNTWEVHKIPSVMSDALFKEGDYVKTVAGSKAKLLSIKDTLWGPEGLIEHQDREQSIVYLHNLKHWDEPEVITPANNWDNVCNDLWDKYTLD